MIDLVVSGREVLPEDNLGAVLARRRVRSAAPNSRNLDCGPHHLRGVEAARWEGAAGAFTLTSLDVPILCTGKASPFVTPRTKPPDMALGVHWNIF